ncbi:MAG: peptide MFS transporter [Atopobiaceae bacterium]|jgi:POT family proton-dependent oligopeptide transporter
MAADVGIQAEDEEQFDPKTEAILNDQGFFGHPKGVGALSLGTLCNSFAWGAVYAVLIYYLYSPFTKGLGFTEGQAGTIVSAMGAMNSLFVIVGSWLSDRVMGPKRALVIGNVVKAIAFALLAIPAPTIELARVLGLSGVILMGLPIMGSSNPSLLGMLYRRKDHARRDAGFTINNTMNAVSGAVAPILIGNLAADNYHLGFAVGAVWALLYGLVIFVFRHKFFGDIGEHPARPLSKEEASKIGKIVAIVAVIAIVVLAVTISTNTLTFDGVINVLTTVSFIIPIAFLTQLFRNKKISAQEHANLKPFLHIWIIYVVVMIASTLINSAIAIFVDSQVNRTFMGFEFAPATFTTVYNIFGIIAGPVFVWLWATKFGRKVGTTEKFGAGVFAYALGYLVLSFPVLLAMQGKVSPLLPIIYYLFMTIGDTMVFPIGNSVTARLAPKSYETQMQSAWSQATTIANAVCMILMNFFPTAESQLTIFPLMTVVLVVTGIIVMIRAKAIDKLLV